jgi:hypothetical protein
MSEKEQDEERREEKKEARRSASLLLKRLRRMCETLDRIDEWQEIAADAKALLDTYTEVIPPAREQRIREALELPRATLEAAKQACSVLQTEVEGLIEYLRPAPGPTSVAPAPGFAAIVATGVIIVAVAVFALTLTSNITAASIRVDNSGCGDLPVLEALESALGLRLADSPLLSVLGIELPAIIADGGSEVISIPPLGLDIDNESEPSELWIRALGLELPLPIGEPTDIRFDGEPMLGRQATIRLRARAEHHLVIRCGE